MTGQAQANIQCNAGSQTTAPCASNGGVCPYTQQQIQFGVNGQIPGLALGQTLGPGGLGVGASVNGSVPFPGAMTTPLARPPARPVDTSTRPQPSGTGVSVPGNLNHRQPYEQSTLAWKTWMGRGVTGIISILIFVALTYFLGMGVFAEKIDSSTDLRIDPRTGLPIVDGVALDEERQIVYLGPHATITQRMYAADLQAHEGWTLINVTGSGVNAEDEDSSSGGGSGGSNGSGGSPVAGGGPAVVRVNGPCPVCPLTADELQQALRTFDTIYRENEYHTAFGLMSNHRSQFRELRDSLVRALALAEGKEAADQDGE